MTIKAKLVLLNLMVFGLLVSTFAYFIYERTQKNELSLVDARLEVLTNKIITQFEDEWEEEQYPDWKELLIITTEGLLHPGITVQNSAGEIVVSTGKTGESDQTAFTRALEGQISRNTKVQSDILIRTSTTPIRFDNKVPFVVTVSTSLESVNERLENLLFILILSVIVTTFIAAIIIYLVTRVTFSPMLNIVKTAEGITAETLHSRINSKDNNDEVSRLGQALNKMMDRIEIAFKSQKRFVSEASHELRTPLTVIIGELEYLQKQLQQSEFKENVTIALEELDRLVRLVDQLLTLTRIDANRLILNKSTMRLDELVLDCVGFLKIIAKEKGIKFNLQINEAINILADSTYLKSAILNIIDNAIKYSPFSSTVSIFLETSNDKKLIFLKISDEGSGILVSEKAQIFDRFYRAKEVRADSNGSGLGLSIAKELIELHQGTIEIQSNSPKGTSIIINFPL